MGTSLPQGPLTTGARPDPYRGKDPASLYREAARRLRSAGGPLRHLYLHIPFCERICPYCDFSTAVGAGADVPGFLDALRAERVLLEAADVVPARSAGEAGTATLFLGGGTPSWLETADLTSLVREVSEWMGVGEGSSGWNEATVEMNPEHASPERIEGLALAGVTRISLGVQSLDPVLLRRLGRVHTPSQVAEAAAAVRAAGLLLSVDLIFAVPGQTLEGWMDDLEKALALEPGHLSLYNLTYEEGTPFTRWRASGRLVAQEDSWESDAYEAAVRFLADAGLARYEVSNFAYPGEESAHNRAYWGGADYLGAGPAAHSLIRGIRVANRFRVDDWQRSVERGSLPLAFAEELDDLAIARERVLLGLRTREGVDPGDIPEALRPVVQRQAEALIEEGFAQLSEAGRIVLTDRGMLVADAAAVRMAP